VKTPKNKDHLLIDSDELLILHTQLAVVVGDRHAIVLQQIHYWLDLNRKTNNKGHYFDDHWWMYNSWTDWQANNFPFWSLNTIRRIFEDLMAEGLIVMRPHENSKRGAWVTINYGQLEIHAQSKGKELKIQRAARRKEVSKLESFQNGNNVSKMETYPAQIGQETREPETTTETTKNGLPVATTGKRRNDWRGNTPIAPSGEASTTNEGKAYRSLELYLLKAIQKQKLTDPQREALWGTVRVLSRETSNAYPSPVDLYDDNEQFKVFAEEKINSIVNSSNGKSGATAIVNALRGYEHPNGWLAYQLKQGGPVTPERSSETPSEPVKSGFVPGERFKL